MDTLAPSRLPRSASSEHVRVELVCVRAIRTWPILAAYLGISLLLGGATGCAPRAAKVTETSSNLHASTSVQGSAYQLGNQSLSATFLLRGGHPADLVVEDKLHHRSFSMGDAFSFTLSGGKTLSASQMQVIGTPAIEDLQPVSTATRVVERVAGKRICTSLQGQSQPGQAESLSPRVHWCLVLRDDTQYLRETLTLEAQEQPVPIDQVVLLNFEDAGAHVSGTVAGSPVVDDTTYFGFEHPLSKSEVTGSRVKASLKRTLPLAPHQSITYSAVIGISDKGQMRRSFLSYIERERAHPYRAFLTYNSWFDLGYGQRYTEAGALDRVHAFGEELARKRGAQLDSFLFDDGWDNPRSLWQFDSGFPNGFTAVGKSASTYGAGIGVWLSPWGGYDAAKKTRIAYGRQHGYEIVKDGYALSGPRYYQVFEQACLDMVAKYHVNQFKFDGTGNADQVVAGSSFDSDFAAAIHLIEKLRQQKPDIFINLTTGTYPSPFWLQYADSIWRGGEDHDFAGVGDWRQKWITYRDAQTYKHIVQAGPLYPLNSLMTHGIIYAKDALHMGAHADPANAVDSDFADEVWSYFGSGTDMQEMYITPSLLNAKNWDVLASGAKWSRANSAVLRDTHWLGGDPGALEVYGWGAWNADKGVIVLRNPSTQVKTYSLEAQAAFELPTGAPQAYRVTNPQGESGGVVPVRLVAGTPQTITLQPFQVMTLEAHPER